MLSCLQATSVGKFMKRNEGCVVGFIATQLVWRKELEHIGCFFITEMVGMGGLLLGNRI